MKPAALFVLSILFVLPFVLLTHAVSASNYCEFFGVNLTMNVSGSYEIAVDKCVYQGSTGFVYVNVSQHVVNVSYANLSINLSFPVSAAAQLQVQMWNASSGSWSNFANINDSSFNWSNNSWVVWRINYTVASGFQGKFNITANLSGSFGGFQTWVAIHLDPVISCNPPASGDWIVNASSWLVCDRQTINFSNTLYVYDFSNATFNNTIWITASNSTLVNYNGYDHSTLMVQASSLNFTVVNTYNTSRALLSSSTIDSCIAKDSSNVTINSINFTEALMLRAIGLNAPSATISDSLTPSLMMIADGAAPSIQFGSKNSTVTSLLIFAFWNSSEDSSSTIVSYTGPFVINDTIIDNSSYLLRRSYVNITASLISNGVNFLNGTANVTFYENSTNSPIAARNGNRCQPAYCLNSTYYGFGPSSGHYLTFSALSFSSSAYSFINDTFPPSLVFNVSGSPTVMDLFFIYGNYSDDYVASANYTITAQGNPLNMWANGTLSSMFNVSRSGAYLPPGNWVVNTTIIDTAGNVNYSEMTVVSQSGILPTLVSASSQSATINTSGTNYATFAFVLFTKGAPYVRMFVNLTSSGGNYLVNPYAQIGNSTVKKTVTAYADYTGTQSFAIPNASSGLPNYVQNSSGIYNGSVTLYLQMYSGLSAGTYSGVYGWGLFSS